MPFLPSNQQHQSTEGKMGNITNLKKNIYNNNDNMVTGEPRTLLVRLAVFIADVHGVDVIDKVRVEMVNAVSYTVQCYQTLRHVLVSQVPARHTYTWTLI